MNFIQMNPSKAGRYSVITIMKFIYVHPRMILLKVSLFGKCRSQNSRLGCNTLVLHRGEICATNHNSFVTRDFSANEKRCIQCLQISFAHNIAHLNRGIICYN